MSETYDAIIIGAGIGGLVCGCYLAKAGMKVLICEQHYKPGGYCTSFRRGPFTFDAAAHSLGGFKYGNIGKIFEDLELYKKIKIKKYDPSNIIITPDYRFHLWDDLKETIREFQTAFPTESKGIKDFFYFIVTPDSGLPVMKSWTFKNLLDTYFHNEQLKAILSFPLISNGGMPPSLISAFIGTKIFKEFLLDGGYYPEGGMQILSNAFAERFKELGGELKLSCPVKKIIVKYNKVMGAILKDGEFILSRYVISNCDARQTFFKLLGKSVVKEDFLKKIDKMLPSLSAFILYLGIDEHFNKLPALGTNMWFLSNYDLDNVYLSAKKGDFNNIGGYLLYIYPDKKRILAVMNAPFKNKKYWINNKKKLADSFLKKIEINAIPSLSYHVKYKDAATPHTLYRYTFNYKGAGFGWACIPSQLALTDFRKPSFIQGLFLTGHWTTKGYGIPGVTYVGYDTAKMILRKEKIKNYVSKIVL